jgi:hypothetical protein
VKQKVVLKDKKKKNLEHEQMENVRGAADKFLALERK